MTDYKLEAAKAAALMISAGQTIGLGGGKTIAYLVEQLAAQPALLESLTVTSSSFDTTALLHEKGFKLVAPAFIGRLDIYFDGCDADAAQWLPACVEQLVCFAVKQASVDGG